MKLKKLYTKLLEKIEPILKMHHVDMHNHMDVMHSEMVERFNLLENKIMLLEAKIDEEKMHDLRGGNIEFTEPKYGQSPLFSWAAARSGGLSCESLHPSEGERNLSEPESKIEIDSELTEITKN